jgi:UDP-2,4-diacetamido-2,4,6-trideoxy-beta-L-altropyranose hydrolase
MVKLPLRVAFRAEASEQVGFGHLRRCVSLAVALRELDVTCIFLVSREPQVHNLLDRVGFGHAVIDAAFPLDETIALVKQTQSDVLVVDSYNYGGDHFQEFASAGFGVVAIDDLANRELGVDLVVNASPGAEGLQYRGTRQTTYLLGPRYALLRPEFGREPHRRIRAHVERVLVTLGGGDPYQLTARLVAWIAETLPRAVIDVVLGPLAGAELGCLKDSRVCVHRDVLDMRSLMLRADVAVNAGGQTTYELAATGTPSLTIRLADNQQQNIEQLEAARVLNFVGDACDTNLKVSLSRALVQISEDIAVRRNMSARGRALVDGQGATRVAHAIAEMARTFHYAAC